MGLMEHGEEEYWYSVIRMMTKCQSTAKCNRLLAPLKHPGNPIQCILPEINMVQKCLICLNDKLFPCKLYGLTLITLKSKYIQLSYWQHLKQYLKWKKKHFPSLYFWYNLFWWMSKLHVVWLHCVILWNYFAILI